jgi:hypothetical protein
MNYFVIDGIILKIDKTQTFGNFKKREIVIVTEDEKPEELKFEFADETGIKALDNYIEGETVTIAFLIKGNEYQGKHYVNLRAIAIGEKTVKEVDGKKVKKVKTKPVVIDMPKNDDDLNF